MCRTRKLDSNRGFFLAWAEPEKVIPENTWNPTPWTRKLASFSKAIKKSYSGPENLNKSKPKKLVKSNKSISQFFLTKFHFLPFQKWQTINFWSGIKFKLPQIQFHEKKFWLQEFFCLDFFKFSGQLWNPKPKNWDSNRRELEWKLLGSKTEPNPKNNVKLEPEPNPTLC